jgi:subtilase family serine protease
VQIEIDPDNALAESNEGNNELLLSFTPPPPCE